MTGRTLQRRVNLTDRLARSGPRKLLAIDGGGSRGVLALMVLAKIESMLIEEANVLTIGWLIILTMSPAPVPAESSPPE